MSAASSLSGDTPPAAGGAAPGARLLGLVRRIGDAAMAVARDVNRIARQRLQGQEIRRMAPPGFSATHTYFLVVQAVAWTAALRERLLALTTVRPSVLVAAARPAAARAPRGQGAADYLPAAVPNPTEEDWHDWRELAKPVRIGAGGVAVATRQIAGMSSQDVVTAVCGVVSQALVNIGAAADVAALEAIAAEARALLPQVERAADDGAAAVGDAAAAAGGGPEVSRAEAPACRPAEEEPPPKPPD